MNWNCDHDELSIPTNGRRVKIAIWNAQIPIHTPFDGFSVKPPTWSIEIADWLPSNAQSTAKEQRSGVMPSAFIP
jgi:hypothetical protein